MLVNTLPLVPGATTCKDDVPLPSNTLLAARVATPVPPLATPRVPPSVTAPVVFVLGVKPVVPPLKDATVLAVVAKVPDVGSVTDVVPVTVKVVPNAPLIVKVLAELLATPVPP